MKDLFTTAGSNDVVVAGRFLAVNAGPNERAEKGDAAVMKRLIASGARADARAVDGRGLDANALAEGQGNGAMTGLLKRTLR